MEPSWSLEEACERLKERDRCNKWCHMVPRCSASHQRVHTFAFFFPTATAAWNAHWKEQQVFFASKAGSDMKNNQRTAQNTNTASI